MIKLSKFYIPVMCAAVLLSGCGKTQQTMQEEPVTEQVQEAVKEEVLHPVVQGGVDYLSVEGIELEPGVEIAMVATNSDNPYWDVVKEGATKAVADLNAAMGFSGKSKISFAFATPQGEDVIEQINIIDQFLDKAPDALCVAFTDASASKTQIQMAKNNGIRVFAFDTPDDSFLTEGMITTNNPAAATEAAAKLYEAIGYEGKVAVIVHNSLTKTGQERKQAIVDELATNYNDKNIQFVDIVYLAQEDRTAEEIFEKLLDRNPDLAGVICTDLMTTEMVIDYTKKMEEVPFKIVGFDVSEKIISEVGGLLEGTVAQDPYGIGYATIIAAARTIAGLENAEVVYTDHQWIDKDNLQTPQVQSLLNY